jgi:hypothetical protein
VLDAGSTSLRRSRAALTSVTIIPTGSNSRRQITKNKIGFWKSVLINSTFFFASSISA